MHLAVLLLMRLCWSWVFNSWCRMQSPISHDPDSLLRRVSTRSVFCVSQGVLFYSHTNPNEDSCPPKCVRSKANLSRARFPRPVQGPYCRPEFSWADSTNPLVKVKLSQNAEIPLHPQYQLYVLLAENKMSTMWMVGIRCSIPSAKQADVRWFVTSVMRQSNL